MKIFAYIGSYRGEKSANHIIVEQLIDKIKDYFEVDAIIRTPENSNIFECRGCCTCFAKGECILKDDILKIKKELLEADLIILATPVYVHGVSGNFKTFIDRIGHWTHLFKLAGKTAVCVNVSSNNGNGQVNAYLSEIINYFGLSLLDSISVKVEETYPEALNSQITGCVRKIKRAYKKDEFVIDNMQELFFQKQKNAFLNDNMTMYEEEYWKNSTIKDFHSFKELFYTLINKEIGLKEECNYGKEKY